jgi:hypothetical protein
MFFFLDGPKRLDRDAEVFQAKIKNMKSRDVTGGI